MAIDLTNGVGNTVSKAVNAVNTFNDLSPQVGQMKTNLSLSQKSQLQSLSGVTGVTGGAGRVAGNLTNVLAGVDNTTASVINVSSNLSSALDGAGITNSTAQKLITERVSGAVINKIPIDKAAGATPTDLGKVSNRLPKAGRKNPVKEIQKTRDKLLGLSDDSYAGTQFPHDLGTGTAKSWIRLQLLEYSRDNAFSPGITSETGKVLLPLPKQLMEMFSVNYDSKDIGVFVGGLLSAGGQPANQVLDTVGRYIREEGAEASEIMSKIEQAAGEIDSEEVKQISRAKAQDFGTSALASAGQEGLAGLADQIVGGVPNPHSTVFFKGVNLRTFTWNWYLVPRSKNDANSLKSVLTVLKRATLPDLDGTILRYPNIVFPEIGGQNTIDMKFKKCMIGDLGIDYTPDAQAFHEDGAPVAVNLSITFKEIEIFTQDDL